MRIRTVSTTSPLATIQIGSVCRVRLTPIIYPPASTDEKSLFRVPVANDAAHLISASTGPCTLCCRRGPYFRTNRARMIGLSHRRFDPEAFGCDWYELLQAAKAYSFDDRLEASVRHALRVERHVLWGAAHRSHLLHHPGID